MKKNVKRIATVALASMMIGIGAVGTAVDFPLVQNTSITAEAASVGKVLGLTSKTLSNSEIKLSWKKVSGASGYSVCMRKNGKYPQIADVKGTTYTVKNLPNATRENFKVRAYKLVNGKKVYGAYSDNWNTATNPQQVTQLKVASVTSSSVKLTWKKIGCTNYRVYQLKSGEWKEIATVTSNSYIVKNLSANSSYQFKVRACKKDDKKTNYNHYGKYSDAITAQTSVEQVHNVNAETLSNSQIKLNWNKVSGASGYSVCMRKSGKYPQIADVKGTSYTVKNLPNATRENFKVRAYKLVNGKKVYGSFSENCHSATNPQKSVITSSSASKNSVSLKWKSIGCTSYQIYVSENKSWKLYCETNDTSYEIKGLTSGTCYDFKVRALKKDDNRKTHYGEYSEVVTIKTNENKKITQEDIDQMRRELQEYSNSQAKYVQEHYTEFWRYGIDYTTLEEYFQMCINESTPENSGYDSVATITFDTDENLDNIKSNFYSYIDYEYKERPKTYYVVYVEVCPNGHRVNSNPCWAVYFLT